MTTKTRRGSWRQVAPGTYIKDIGTYGNVKFGARARVSFVPFPTCEIIDATGAHADIPTPADAKKYISAAKKVYVKDTKATTSQAARKAAAPTRSTVGDPAKWTTGTGRSPPSISSPFRPDEIKLSAAEARVERKLVTTDTARRKKAHSLWLSGKEPGTPRDIYLRLYAADAAKYRK